MLLFFEEIIVIRLSQPITYAKMEYIDLGIADHTGDGGELRLNIAGITCFAFQFFDKILDFFTKKLYTK